MGAFADRSIQVTSFDYQPVQGAQVTAEREGQPLASGTTDERGRVRIERDDGAELRIRVEAPGFASEERTVTGDRPEQVELFMLGRPGMPFYYRGRVRVPFEPVNDAVGVLLRNPGEGTEDEVAARADRVAERFRAGVIRSHANFARSGIAVVGVPSDSTAGAEALLQELDSDDEIEQAGALVKLNNLAESGRPRPRGCPEAQRERIAGLAVDDAWVRAVEARAGQAEAALHATQAGLAQRAAALDDAQARADARERAADEQPPRRCPEPGRRRTRPRGGEQV